MARTTPIQISKKDFYETVPEFYDDPQHLNSQRIFDWIQLNIPEDCPIVLEHALVAYMKTRDKMIPKPANEPKPRGDAKDHLFNAGQMANTGRATPAQKLAEWQARTNVVNEVRKGFNEQQTRLLFKKALQDAELLVGDNPRNHAETYRVRAAAKLKVAERFPQYANEVK